MTKPARKQDWRTAGHLPPKGTASIALITAIRIIDLYGKKIPEKEQLVRDFGCHKSTASRWLVAIRAARWLP